MCTDRCSLCTQAWTKEPYQSYLGWKHKHHKWGTSIRTRDLKTDKSTFSAGNKVLSWNRRTPQKCGDTPWIWPREACPMWRVQKTRRSRGKDLTPRGTLAGVLQTKRSEYEAQTNIFKWWNDRFYSESHIRCDWWADQNFAALTLQGTCVINSSVSVQVQIRFRPHLTIEPKGQHEPHLSFQRHIGISSLI